MTIDRTNVLLRISAVAVVVAVALSSSHGVMGWGAEGHVMAGKAAALALPDGMPAFFKQAADQLAYLNPEPDRWRSDLEAQVDPALRDGFNPDHYINLERVPSAALNAPNRFVYLLEMQKAGVESAAAAGLSPFRTVELFQRLRAEFRLWRGATDEKTRQWIEQRIINDAGILGHYVTDAANPLHTTIHTNGWIGDNPHGYAVDKSTHSRFESQFVRARIAVGDISSRVVKDAKVVADPRGDVLKFIRTSHTFVETLYQIDKRARFDEQTTAEENKRFAAERLAFGATMLRDLWWTAYVTSAPAGTSSPAPRH